jgi:hypothetical protein
MQSGFSVDPLYALERSRAEASGKRPSKRELSEMGNRPLPESPRRAPVTIADEWSPARKAAESLFSSDTQDLQKSVSAVRQALEALFESKP